MTFPTGQFNPSTKAPRGFAKYSPLSQFQISSLEGLLQQAMGGYNSAFDTLKSFLPGGQGYDSRVQSLAQNYRQQVLPGLMENLLGNRSSSALNQALATGASQLQQQQQADQVNIAQLLAQLSMPGIQQGTEAYGGFMQKGPSTLEKVANYGLDLGKLLATALSGNLGMFRG